MGTLGAAGAAAIAWGAVAKSGAAVGLDKGAEVSRAAVFGEVGSVGSMVSVVKYNFLTPLRRRYEGGSQFRRKVTA